MKKYLILFTALFLITSCSTQRFSVNSKMPIKDAKYRPHFTKSSNFFFWGIGQETILNANELCKQQGGVSFVESQLTLVQGLIAGITYGIYSPRTNNIYCNKN